MRIKRITNRHKTYKTRAATKKKDKDEASNMDMFLNELPDSTESLIPQINCRKSLVKFRKFPALPVELRLHIWHLLFPQPRTVAVNPHYYCDCGWQSKIPPPITLFINQESRAETLKHYSSIQIPPCPVGERAPLYFSPVNDTIQLGKSHEFHEALLPYAPFTDDYLHIMKQVSQIQHLRVTGACCCDDAKEMLEISALHHSGPNLENTASILQLMHNLKNLTLVAFGTEGVAGTISSLDEEGLRRYKARFKKMFRKEKTMYPKCKIPRISIEIREY